MYQFCSHGDPLGQDVGTFQMCLSANALLQDVTGNSALH